METIDNLGKGALPDKPDYRDLVVSFAGSVNVDWSKEYRLPDPGDDDQGSSDSCVAHAWSYYHKQLIGKDYSRRDLFCRIFLDYGAYIRDGGKEIVGNGHATKAEVPDPNNQTEANMRSKAGTSPDKRIDDIEANYFVLPQQDINGVAWGIKNYKGVVFGVQGDNAGWKDHVNPIPPSYGVPVWGHALYAMGFHMHNDQKCIIAKSSWTRSGAKEHHIKETYFITGNTFSAWTLIARGGFINEHIKIINYKGTMFIAVGAKNVEQAKALGEAFGKKVEINSKGEITNADITLT